MENGQSASNLGADCIIDVPERGYQNIDLELWRQLCRQPDFAVLAQQHLLHVVMGPDYVRLQGTCWVGQALFGGILLRLTEKTAGALHHLLRYATQDAFKVAHLSTPATTPDQLVSLLLREFLVAVEHYAYEGLAFQYTNRRSVGTLAAGRLDIPRTLRLHAQGQRHLLAVEQRVLAYDTPINRIVFAALREVERLAWILAMSHQDRLRARRLLILFAGVFPREMLLTARVVLMQEVQQLTTTTTSPAIRDLLALAGTVLAHQSFDLTDALIGRVPRAWFLNLEDLFERAVWQVLSHLGRSCLMVQRGPDALPKRQLFERSLRHPLHPDLLLKAQEKIIAVGDVKYKSWSEAGDRDDLNQLVVYMGAYQAPGGFLVYPGDQFDVRVFGATSVHAWPNNVWLFGVRVGALEDDLRQVLHIITPS